MGVSAAAFAAIALPKSAFADDPQPRHSRGGPVPVGGEGTLPAIELTPEQRAQAEIFAREVEILRPYLKVDELIPSLQITAEESSLLGVSLNTFGMFSKLVQTGSEQLRAIPLAQRQLLVSESGITTLPRNRVNLWCGYIDRRVLEGAVVLAIAMCGAGAFITGVGAILVPPAAIPLGYLAAVFGLGGVSLGSALWIIQAFYPPYIYVCV